MLNELPKESTHLLQMVFFISYNMQDILFKFWFSYIVLKHFYGVYDIQNLSIEKNLSLCSE